MMPPCGTWAYWAECCWPQVWRLMLPTRYVQPEPPPFIDAPDGSGGLFDIRRNIIWLHPANDNLVVNAHEYGHWIAWRAMHLFNALWELPWHGLGLGNRFVRHRRYRQSTGTPQ